MNRPRHILPIILAATLLSWAAGTGLHAQPPPCDSLSTATFSHADLGGYLYSFSPVPAAGTNVFATEWGFLGEDFDQFSLAQQPQVTFPSEGDYLVCLRATLSDDQQSACTSVHCELVSVAVDAACAGLQPAFTISVQDGAILFADQTVSDGPVQSVAWNFGDGSGSTEASPTHIYPGMGPYEACLTATTANCTATVCNWIYLGPADVPCDTLLHAAIGVIQYERTVAVFDQSITSGMNSSMQWDFGDGHTASGSPVIHTYAQDGFFDLCGSVSLWGPLAIDTCEAQACQWVTTNPSAAGVGRNASGSSPCAFPVPFSDGLTIEGAAPGAGWSLTDVLGMDRLSGIVPADGAVHIEGKNLRAGVYFVRIASRSGTTDLRVVKYR